MAILFLIPINRLILNIWIWLTRHVFRREGNKRLVWTSIVVGGLAALSLFFYPYLLDVSNIDRANYLDQGTYLTPNFLLPLIIYIVAIVIVSNLLTLSKLVSTQWIVQLIAWGALLMGGYFLFGYLAVAPLMLYYLIVAASEEGIKYLSSIQLAKTWTFTTSDCILFAILIALGYAFVENIIYMLQSTEILSSLADQLQVGSNVLLSRGIVGFLVHILFTGSIAYISLTCKNSVTGKRVLSRLIALCIGIALHFFYNLSIVYEIKRGFFLFVVAGYLFLTFMFYKSDSIYIEE